MPSSDGSTTSTKGKKKKLTKTRGSRKTSHSSTPPATPSMSEVSEPAPAQSECSSSTPHSTSFEEPTTTTGTTESQSEPLPQAPGPSPVPFEKASAIVELTDMEINSDTSESAGQEARFAQVVRESDELRAANEQLRLTLEAIQAAPRVPLTRAQSRKNPNPQQKGRSVSDASDVEEVSFELPKSQRRKVKKGEARQPCVPHPCSDGASRRVDVTHVG